MLTRTQKEEAVVELRERLGRATSVFVADYRGLTVDQVNDLRSKLRQSEDDYQYHVTKNTLLRRATADTDLAPLEEQFNGPTAIALSFGEPVGLAKVLVDYAKENDAFELRAGFMDGKPLGVEEIATLATLPSLEALRSQLVGLLQAPAQKVAAVLQAPAAQMARLVEARRTKLEESGGGE